MSRVLELRRLCAFYEWSEPPNLAVADVLQSAADGVQNGTLSPEAADLLIAAWAPFAGAEALAGNAPPTYTIAETDDDLRKAIIADLRRMVAKETTPARKLHLAKLLDEQVRRFRGDDA